MKVSAIRKENFEKAYGILCHRVYPDADLKDLPFGSTWCLVNPLDSTHPHAHFEGESFFILNGQGVMDINGEKQKVQSGDVIHIPAYSTHQLSNTSLNEALEFLSMWWAPPSLMDETLPQTVMITAAPPTPNGDLHLGHLSGPYVAADVFSRYLKMRGVQAKYFTGSDDHQSYVLYKAQKTGVTAEEVVKRFADANEATLTKVNAMPDDFLRPSQNQEYVRFVQAFFKKLLDNGSIEIKTAPSLHCDTCQIYLFEAHVRGKCPTCRSCTNGNGCESCGMTNDPVDLIEPYCNHCNQRPIVKNTKRAYFNLERFREPLQNYFEKWPFNSHLRAMTETLMLRELPSMSVSHISPWGIPVPDERLEGQTIFVWLEMAAGYAYLTEKNGRSDKFYQFFGFDNGFFYTTFIPAVLLAFDPDFSLPHFQVSNEFYRLDGEKFSTSRQHAIWGDEILKYVSGDIVRFFLSYDRPENEQTNFCLQNFKDTVRKVLVGQLEYLLVNLDEALSSGLDRKVPALDLSHPAQDKFYRQLVMLTAAVTKAYSADQFSLQTVVRSLNDLLDLTQKFHQAHQFLKHIPRLRLEWLSSLSLEATALKTFALLGLPIMPESCEHILEALGVTEAVWDSQVTPLKEGTEIKGLATDFFSKSLRQIERFEKARMS